MATVTIKLASDELMRDIYFVKDKVSFFNENRMAYIACKSFECEVGGENAADEAFDLTNNPTRQDERVRLYGRGRSLSVGDVVEVDGVEYVCDRIGWKQVA